jgi:hypothetical protein
MPQYYSIKNWQNRGNVVIIPKQFWRRSFLGNIVPFHVGDQVEFVIHIDCPYQPISGYSFLVWEKFEDSYNIVGNIDGTVTSIVGNRINVEGNIEYCIGMAPNPLGADTIFTAVVQNWDTVINQWLWAIVGAFFMLIVGILLWLLGVIEIIPHWQLFIK